MKNILCFGDSNTWGNDAASYDPLIGSGRRMLFEERWPGALQLRLGGNYRIIEDALNGRTIMMEDNYFPHRRGLDALETALDAQAPLDLVIIALGCNELKQMFHLAPGMIAFGAEQLVIKASESYYGYPAPKVLLVAPAPVPDEIGTALFGPNFGPDAGRVSRALGVAFRDVADRHSCAFLDCAELDFELNDLDMLHYSRADHEKLAAALEPIIRSML